MLTSRQVWERWQDDLPHELMDCMVPRLILQPVIENAVEHGIGPGGQGHIALRGCRRDSFLILEIGSNGGLTPEDAAHIRRLLSPDHDMAGEPSGSIGIANVNQRLRILYGPDCGLSIFSGEGSLVTARLTIALPKVLTDFETGAEPDVLFFFTDADAEPFIEADKVVDIASIRAEYPDYAANMRDSMMAVAADGKSYAVPSSGFWENMFVNTKVLVDDESIIVEGLRQVLDWEAYRCQVCATASDAVSGARVIREHRPDILFTDIKMSGEDGLTMLAGLAGGIPPDADCRAHRLPGF